MSNCICWFTPQGGSSQLRIISNLTTDRFPAPLAPFEADDPRSPLPVVYDLTNRLVLAPFMTPVTDDADGGVLTWLRAHMDRPDEPVFDVLARLNSAIHREFGYVTRQADGVQTPAETLAFGSGACRDLAWLMVEAVRQLRFAALFVTSDLYSAANAHIRGAGATRAWCQVFLPGLGWLEFDPTNGLIVSPNLIQVAATRSPAEAAPVAGSLIGDPGNSTLNVRVDVDIARDNPAPA